MHWAQRLASQLEHAVRGQDEAPLVVRVNIVGGHFNRHQCACKCDPWNQGTYPNPCDCVYIGTLRWECYVSEGFGKQI